MAEPDSPQGGERGSKIAALLFYFALWNAGGAHSSSSRADLLELAPSSREIRRIVRVRMEKAGGQRGIEEASHL